MTRAKSGDTVRIHYTGKLPDGTQFDSSQDRAPIEIRLGASQLLPGLESRVEGMQVGAKATVTLPPNEAFGDYDPGRVHAVPRSRIPEGVELGPGKPLRATTSDGELIALTVVEVGKEEVKVDANHPLAGQTLVFDIELVEIVQAA